MRRWWLGLAFVVVACCVLAAAGWHDLNSARVLLGEARDGLARAVDDPAALRTAEGRAAAQARIAAGVADVDVADRRLRHSLPLLVTRVVPGFSRQRAGALQLIRDARTAAVAGEGLLRSADRLANSVQFKNGVVPLDGLEQLESVVRQAGGRLRPLARKPSGLWGSLATARRSFDEVASSTAERLSSSADAIAAARTFMGEAGARRYLVAAENNSEMRDQGMVLSYSVVSFAGGRLTFERSGSVSDLALTSPAPVTVPAGTRALFNDMGPSQLWQSVNATADFAWSGQAMAAMYHQATGQTVDGVIALDVPGLASILRAVGGVDVAGINERVGPDNVARILLNDLYAQVPVGDQTPRREREAEVAAATVAKLTSGAHDAVALGREFGDAASGGHFRLWSSSPDEERVFERTGLGGGPATAMPDRTFHVAVQNVNATKLDYFVKPKVRMDISVSALGTAVIRTMVTVVNTAPKNAQPSYQFGPSQRGDRAGEYVTRTQLWGPVGATQLESVEESGLLANQVTLSVPGGTEISATFETIVPRSVRNGRLDLRLVPQARLYPMDLDLEFTAPGWKVTGPLSVKRPWDRTFIQTWSLHH